MTYSWYNISHEYKNNIIRYGVLSEEKDDKQKVDNPYVVTYYNIELSPGSYSYDNINDYIKGILILNNHPEGGIKLKLDFDLSKLNV